MLDIKIIECNKCKEKKRSWEENISEQNEIEKKEGMKNDEYEWTKRKEREKEKYKYE